MHQQLEDHRPHPHPRVAYPRLLAQRLALPVLPPHSFENSSTDAELFYTLAVRGREGKEGFGIRFARALGSWCGADE